MLEGHFRTPEGWSSGAMTVDAAGRIGAIEESFVRTKHPILPGIANLHSHAFQRAMAGLAERRQASHDDFWSWRELMYRSLDRLDPDMMLAIATQLYVELVRNGYTRVCEFHYVHNAPAGGRYADPSIMADAIIEAARVAGIGLTLLPVLYTSSGFGGLDPTPGQRRFILTVDDFLAMLASLDARAAQEGFVVGTALHSLRAVTPDHLAAVLHAREAGPIHIHAAEQEKEVDACLAWSGLRPVEWLLNHAAIDQRWTVVHATHMTDAEAAALARRGATVALCPTTEASLGDGFFNAAPFLQAGGRFGIGSDSNVCTDPCEELRLFEYGRRLTVRRRVLGVDRTNCNAGAWAWLSAAAGGTDASGAATGTIRPGMRADLVVLDREHPSLCGASGDALVDAAVFGGGGSAVRETWIAGRRVVADGQHQCGEASLEAYRATMTRLKESL